MTHQETFDIVVNPLRKQGCRSLNNQCCVYKGSDGTKCAAGCLIPDRLYDPVYEGATILDKNDKARLVGRIIEEQGHDLLLVRRLQRVHDLYSPVDQWEREFVIVAEEFGLEYRER